MVGQLTTAQPQKYLSCRSPPARRELGCDPINTSTPLVSRLPHRGLGPRNYPYLSGPSYTDADLAVAKTFHIVENQTVTLRASAFNFINHPLAAFSGNQLSLYYNTDYVGKASTLTSVQAVVVLPRPLSGLPTPRQEAAHSVFSNYR